MDILKNNERFSSIASDCHSCVINQALSAASLAELSEEQTIRILIFAKNELALSKTTPLLVQHIIRSVTDAIIEELEESFDYDIYADVKENSNALALDYVEIFQRRIYGNESPFETGLQIAAAGNIIDFGAKNHIDLNLEKEIQSLNNVPFARYDIEPLKTGLKDGSMLLYICDNSGEIVFDMLFIKEIQRQYPNLKIVAALREKPIINDATIDDAKAIGLDSIVTTISSGSIYPGTILPEVSQEFSELYSCADIILAKGQGNFETLLPYADKRLFFLLRIKCEAMAILSKVEKDNLVLMQGR